MISQRTRFGLHSITAYQQQPLITDMFSR